MENKLKIDDIIIVEGKDDVSNLSQVIDATIIPIHGSVGLSDKKLRQIEVLSENNNIIILTDPDFTGKKIRKKINERVNKNIVNIHVSRNKANKDGNIGVENVDKNVIYNIFLEYLNNKDKKNIRTYTYTVSDIIENKLMGSKDSKLRRQMLGDMLKIGYYNSKSLMSVLNGMCLDYDLFTTSINMINKKLDVKFKSGIIFGKFIPFHKGHMNFIKKALELVDKLYVVICFEKDRDDDLIKKSTLPKYISESDRYNFIFNEFKNEPRIEILTLREEGISYYPNGWKDWANRVTSMLKANNVYINSVFTNEIQDKENYLNYFTDREVFSQELDVHLIDKERMQVNVSATKIRNNYNKFKKYLTDYELKYLEDE